MEPALGQRPPVPDISLNRRWVVSAQEWLPYCRCNFAPVKWAVVSPAPPHSFSHHRNQAGSGCWGGRQWVRWLYPFTPSDHNGIAVLGSLHPASEIYSSSVQKGSSWPSNLTCCFTQTTEFQLATPIHTAFAFLPSLSLSQSLFSFACLFQYKEASNSPAASSLLKKKKITLLSKIKTKAWKEAGHAFALLPILLPNQCHRWGKSNRDYMIQSTV